jgi:hypothetical protein
MKLKTCSISNFKLQRNEDKFKLTPHAFKLQFLSGTIVKPNEMPNIPAYFFNLMKYEDIKAMNFSTIAFIFLMCISINNLKFGCPDTC